MKEYKGIVIALIAGICAIICICVFTGGLVDYKKTSGSGGLTATGSANCDFESDLIAGPHRRHIVPSKRTPG